MVQPPPTPADDVPIPEGAPTHVRFDGLLQGRLVDRGGFDAGVAQLRTLGLTALEAEIDHGRFSLLAPAADVPGQAFDSSGRATLAAALQQVVAAAESGSAESSLRATFVWPDRAVDTLFAIRQGRLTPVGAAREAREGDRRPAEAPAGVGVLGSRRVLPLLLLAGLLAVVVVAWDTSWVQGLFASDPADLELRVQPEARALLRAAWSEADEGRPVLRIVAGEELPTSVEAFDRAWAEAGDLAARQRLLRVLGGAGTVRFLSSTGAPLAEIPFDLAPLLRGEPVDLPLGAVPPAATALRVGLSR